MSNPFKWRLYSLRPAAKALISLLPLLRRPFPKEKKREVRLAIECHGGIGDMIISLTWIRELYLHAEAPVQIDLYGRLSLLEPIAAMQSFVLGCYDLALFREAQGYDLKLSMLQFVEIVSGSPGAFAKRAPVLAKIIRRYAAHNKQLGKYYQHRKQGTSFNAYTEYDTFHKRNRWERLQADGAFPFGVDILPSIFLDVDAMEIMESCGLKEQTYITMNTGVDEKFPKGSHPKAWPIANFTSLARLLRADFPEVRLVQIGAGNSEIIPGADVQLTGKTTLEEAAVLLKHAAAHIDSEGGLVHLRRALGGQSTVLFGPTPVEHFGYKENINLTSGVCSPCLWATPQWTDGCMRGFSEPECMKSIAPKTVARAVRKQLSSHPAYVFSLKDIGLYTGANRLACEPLLDDLLQTCKLEKKDISHHILGPNRICFVHASKQWEYPYAISHINVIGKENLKIADVGGGRGALAWYLAEKGHEVTAFDLNFGWDNGGDSALEQKFVAFAKSKGFTAAFGSVFNIPAADNSFDVVTSISVVEHAPFKLYALKEMLRVLKPGGKLILTYDLVLRNHLNRAEAARREIFTPEGVRQSLAELGIHVEGVHGESDVEASIECVLADKLRVAAKDLTFGGLVLEKNDASPSFSNILRQYPQKQHTPYALHNIELTNHCIMKCIMCPREKGMTRARGFMDMALFKNIIDQQVADNPALCGTSSELCLHHFGESLLHPAFDEAIAYAREKGLHAGLSLNPLALSEDKALRLFKAKPAWLLFPLDGYDEHSFSLLRGVSGGYEKSVANALAALECWRKYSPETDLRITIIDNPEYSDTVSATVDLWKEKHGIDMLRKPFSTWNGADESINSMRKEAQEQTLFPCSTPWKRLSVAWDGTVVPCCRDHDNLYPLGNAHQESLSALWNSPKAMNLRSELRSGMVVNALCKNCEKVSSYTIAQHHALRTQP